MFSVTVITPTYNCARFVTQAVDSVLAQTHPAAQIIVSDDGSDDDTPQRLAPYADRILFLQQSNQGVSAARNHAMACATGDFIAFLDSDDIWHPRKLQLHLAAMQSRPDIGMMGTSTFNWPHVIPHSELRTRGAELLEVPWERLVVKNYFTTSSVILRRALLEKVGTFDTALQGPEDYDLWLRLAEITTVANLDLPLTGYRSTEFGLGSRPEKMEEGMRCILQKVARRGAWKSHPGLRSKAHAYMDYSSAYMHSAAGFQVQALIRLLKSILRYPLPLARSEVRMPWARPKLMTMSLLRLLGAKPSPQVCRP